MGNALKSAVLAVVASSDKPDRTYRLRDDEYVPDAVRRVTRGQLEDAHETLSGASTRTLGAAIHDTRKRLKRARTCARLARDAIGHETYDRENTAYRMAARQLAARRDAQVMLETLDAVTERFADELPRRCTTALRARLESEHKHAQAFAGGDDAGIATAVTAIGDAVARTPAWTFDRDGFDALSPGLFRIYRRGRRRMRAARKDPSPENLHEWRKRVKDLWHASQLVRAAQPKRLKRVSKRAHALADLLGDGHDLAVLREYVETHPQHFESKASRRALLAVIDRRSDALRDKALARGEQLYKRSPTRFVGRIERGWNKRANDQPQPLAG